MRAKVWDRMGVAERAEWLRSHCAICETTVGDEAVVYWTYSQRRGYEVPHWVCPRCDRHPKHAAYLVERMVRRQDRR
jgi:hypothetical protein